MKTALRVLLSLSIAAALLAVLMRWGGVSAADLLAAWKHLSWRVYALALCLHVVLYVLRAVRFQILIPRGYRPPFGRLLVICAAHTMAAFILPAKVGEATFVVYTSNLCGLPAPMSIAALVVSRLLDLASLALGMSIACLWIGATGAYPRIEWFESVGATLAVLALFLFALSARGDLLVRCATLASRTLRLDRFERGRALMGKAEQITAALRQAGSKQQLIGATLVSLPIWACVFLFCAVLARGLGLPESIALSEATFGSGLAILTSLLPISAFASFGTLETGWVLGFGVFGISKELAFATGAGLHIVQLFNVVLLGVLGHIGMGLLSRVVRARGPV